MSTHLFYFDAVAIDQIVCSTVYVLAAIYQGNHFIGSLASILVPTTTAAIPTAVMAVPSIVIAVVCAEIIHLSAVIVIMLIALPAAHLMVPIVLPLHFSLEVHNLLPVAVRYANISYESEHNQEYESHAHSEYPFTRKLTAHDLRYHSENKHSEVEERDDLHEVVELSTGIVRMIVRVKL